MQLVGFCASQNILIDLKEEGPGLKRIFRILVSKHDASSKVLFVGSELHKMTGNIKYLDYGRRFSRFLTGGKK